ncbi:CDP-diacylglycerol pyrophosphatase [Ameyamaea chiangmaiensis NBRC 103196]|uniref:CDP-diacylglycerol pyrophosphatase n=1 Tax=Ameyamaea chiangmaiensis TaxID=442969 RepID=A0A850PE47_9PROT|nr:CDP-diacylglycerol diphosphatase [Ameyamaea chiangmaiensis]MBS4074089.1 CDP-diacylglycerol diphosphatase [Ameyamaea chiangmaiensis]NVN40536.1 CDP-diacylglycerol diphosphatase [Ameyamaea chiangmaiensis]GBQ67283.1 CDP-diacylglycerol pyrophosphatase [Ameyamaea chiangmaiensis NBRC 103196]
MRASVIRPVFGAAFVALLIGLPRPASTHNPDRLWQIVDGQCRVAHDRTGQPTPCTVYDADRGYAVLKDIEGRGQYLLIPTARTSGIEAEPLLAAHTPNYFALAWAQRARVGEAYGVMLPDDDLALAINSAQGRTQNQLHIHLDCIRPEIKTALFFMRRAIGRAWTPLPTPLAGHAYRAIRMDGTSFDNVWPFRVLAASLPDAAHDMGRHTLVVVPENFPEGRGFVVLDDVVDPLHHDFASGEELQDHDCRIIPMDLRVRTR